mmetsp:Transcript_1352/g.2283  ORF Transcript_1352/g.2283 Transcript_1352/m.2283 type:complete len:83 (+) Transcript_1352:279-527(+)
MGMHEMELLQNTTAADLGYLETLMEKECNADAEANIDGIESKIEEEISEGCGAKTLLDVSLSLRAEYFASMLRLGCDGATSS